MHVQHCTDPSSQTAAICRNNALSVAIQNKKVSCIIVFHIKCFPESVPQMWDETVIFGVTSTCGTCGERLKGPENVTNKAEDVQFMINYIMETKSIPLNIARFDVYQFI